MQKLGQHFLNDKTTRRKIAGILLRMHAPTIIEIGPGHGELTRELCSLFPKSQIIVIERDTELVKKLLNTHPRVSVYEGDARDILPLLPEKLGLSEDSYVVTGNIPYYITGNLFRILGELSPRPSGAVFMIQKEVAERASAKEPNMNLLSACVQSYSTVSYEFSVPRKLFSPPPRVDSAVISLDFKKINLPNSYFEIVRGIFKQPRKTILNNIHELIPEESKRGILDILSQEQIGEHDRPQTLSVQKIISLAKHFKK